MNKKKNFKTSIGTLRRYASVASVGNDGFDVTI